MAISLATLRSRVETDLEDAVLQIVLDAAFEEIAAYAGPKQSTEVKLSRGAQWIVLDRAIDAIQYVQEWRRSNSSGAVNLAIDDYRIVGITRLLRLTDGTNPAPCWGDEVQITYRPLVLDSLRDRVALSLCLLDIEFSAYDEQESGDWAGDQKDFTERRRSVLAQLNEHRSPII